MATIHGEAPPLGDISGDHADAGPVARVVADHQGVITGWSEGAQQLFGYAPRGLHVTALVCDEPDRLAVRRALSDADEGWHGVLTVRALPGRRLVVSAWIDTLSRPPGLPLYVLTAVDARVPRRRESAEAVTGDGEMCDRAPAGTIAVDTRPRVRGLDAAASRAAAASPGQLPPLAVCASYLEVTEREQAQRRLRVLNEASAAIGTTLDVARTAGELAVAAVPVLADFCTVDLLQGVLEGDEPVLRSGPAGASTCRAGISSIHPDAPEAHYGVGDATWYSDSTPQWRCLATGEPVLVPELDLAAGWFAGDAARSTKIRSFGIHSVMAVPLRARGVTLGVASFNRTERPLPFTGGDLDLAAEFCARAAVSIDNARRYTREYNTALALQRRLLPGSTPPVSSLDVAYRYLPADATHKAGGDWFDVLPLSGARTALVVGDAVGHGLDAAVAMGRLRAAVQTLADLDLPPDEVLARLDDTVGRLAEQETEQGDTLGSLVGSTCLFAIYDPTTCRCTMARAGHWPPVVTSPDGSVRFVDLPPGPPLGLGGLPFEAAEVDLPEGSLLGLYTDGLIDTPGSDVTGRLEQLARIVSRRDRPLNDICDTAQRELMPGPPSDDMALLLVRTRALGADRIARWDLPNDPQAVGRARGLASEQLAAWGLPDQAFVTELVVSELVTNAIRYGREPIALRLLHERVLTVEVSDASPSSPRLRHARTTEEGGRGLFLVAQLTARWGTRYDPHGKTIWAEQPLP